MLAQPPEQPPDDSVSDATSASIPNFAARKSAATRSSGTRSSLARAFIPAISADGDPSLQSRQGREGRRRSRLQVGPIEPDAFIRGKETEVVAKHAEVVLLDLGVGRIEVGGLDLAAGECPVGEVVVEAANVALGQAVAVAHARPAVGPIHEFIAESELELGMSLQVGQTGHAQLRGDLLAHADRIGVIETRAAGSSPRRARPGPRRGRLRRGSSCPPGSRPRSCRCTRDKRRARRPRGRERGPASRPARDDATAGTPASRIRSWAISPRITDSVKTFDPTRTVGSAFVGHEREHEQDGECRHHESPSAASARIWRWALTNWVTNGSAGSIDQRLERPALDDPAVAHQEDLVAEPAGLGEVVRDHDDGLLERSEDRAKVGLKLGADHRVECAQGLIEQDHLGVEHERAHQAHALPLAARELGGKRSSPSLRKPRQLGKLGEPVVDPRRVPSPGSGPSRSRCRGRSSAGKGRHPG